MIFMRWFNNLSVQKFFYKRSDFGVGNVGVNSRLILVGASDSKRNDSGEFAVYGQWATAVSLAGVFAFNTGADHSVSDSEVFWQKFMASRPVENGKFNRLQSAGIVTALLQNKKKNWNKYICFINFSHARKCIWMKYICGGPRRSLHP